MSEMVKILVKYIKAGKHEQRLETEDEAIDSLARSISRIGLLVPLHVTENAGQYEIVCGHRRLKALRKAGIETADCIIVDTDKAKEGEITFAENFFRKDLSPVELACSMKDCLDNEAMTVEELASGFHKSEHWVRSMVAIADWPADVQMAIHNERLSVSAANNLACVTDDDYRAFLLRNAIEQGATARTTASWLQAWRAMQPASEAITSEPVAGPGSVQPAIPQAPCLCCGDMFPVDRMSHVPMCGDCIKVIRQIPVSSVQQ